MNLPGFTAEASLVKTSKIYRMGASVGTEVGSGKIVPQQVFEVSPDIYDLWEDLVATPVIPLPPPSPEDLIFTLPVPLPYPQPYALYVTPVPIPYPEQYVSGTPVSVPIP